MPATGRRSLRIGCSGWNYKSWQDEFYEGKPPPLWLQHYAQYFDTVEVNNTFYRLPLKSSVASWVAQTPPDFLFAVKASRYLTHIKRLTDLRGGIARYYERLEPLVRSPKLGPVLWQLPATFKRDDDRLGAALAALPPGRHCFEFRHPSWFVPEIFELLRQHDAALVIGDHPERRFQSHELTANWTFVRFHYGSRGRGGNYSDRELDEWAARIDAWRRKRIDVYAYFNNDWELFAIRNALWLKRRLSS